MSGWNICTLLIASVLVIGALAQPGFRSACPCRDEQPEGEFTCEQQRKFGKCSEDFMINGGFCGATCDRCPVECPFEAPELDLSCGCTDKVPEGGFTCADQRKFGSCTESWMIDGDYCAATCERCVCVNGNKCSNIPPPGDFLCVKQLEFGKCSESWMEPGGYCRVSCGTCPAEISVDAAIEMIPAVEIVEIVASMPKPEQVPEDFDSQSEEMVLIAPEPEEEEEESEEDSDIVDLSAAVSLATLTPMPEPETEPLPEPELEVSDCNTTLLEVVSGTAELSLLAAMVDASGLASLLEDQKATYTVFAPNNQAVESFAAAQDVDLKDLGNNKSSKRLLQAILGYHIAGNNYTEADLSEMAVIQTLLGEDFLLFVEIIRRNINLEATGSSATILTSDIKVCDSVVHIIDEVLLSEGNIADIKPINLVNQLKNGAEVEAAPEVIECTQLDVLETLENIPEATTFVTALEAVGYEDFPTGPLTIFVPTEEAFQEALSLLGFTGLPAAVATEESREQLLSVLIYHMVQGYFPSDQIEEGVPLTSLSTTPLIPEFVKKTLEIGSGVNTAAVIAADVSETCDLAVHIVDTVLLPQAVDANLDQVRKSTLANLQNLEVQVEEECLTLADAMSTRPELQQLLEVASSAGLDTVLNDPEQEITFFAPINSAFQDLEDALGADSEAVLSNEEYLNAVLAYHALDGVFTSKDLLPGESFPTLVKSRQSDALELGIGESSSEVVIVGQGSSAGVLETDIPACKSVIHIIDTVLLPVSSN